MQVFSSKDGRLTVGNLWGHVGVLESPWLSHIYSDNFKGSTEWGLPSNVKNAHANKHVCNILGLSVRKTFIFCPQIVESQFLMLPESNMLLQPQARNMPMILWNQDDPLEVL